MKRDRRVRSVGPWRIDRAPAKVNLGLRIVGRREDGYHLLDSLVVFADLADHVAIRPTDAPPGLRVRGPFAAALRADAAADNLAMRAARRFRDRFGGDRVDIALWKRLPVAAGIGGGTADAAAVLRLLASARGMALDDPQLAALALDLGADGPMCLAGRAARVGGIGERLDAAPAMPPLPAVLVNPGVPVSTPAVFNARRGPFSRPGVIDAAYTDPAAVARALSGFGNDLTRPAAAVAPVIDAALSDLAADAVFSGMSGSGATCFGLYSSHASAAAAARKLRATRPDWFVAATTLHAS